MTQKEKGVMMMLVVVVVLMVLTLAVVVVQNSTKNIKTKNDFLFSFRAGCCFETDFRRLTFQNLE